LGLPLQASFNPTFATPLTNAFHRAQSHVEFFDDLFVRQTFIGLQKDTRPLPLQTGDAFTSYEFRQRGALLDRQVYDVALLHAHPWSTPAREWKAKPVASMDSGY